MIKLILPVTFLFVAIVCRTSLSFDSSVDKENLETPEKDVLKLLSQVMNPENPASAHLETFWELEDFDEQIPKKPKPQKPNSQRPKPQKPKPQKPKPQKPKPQKPKPNPQKPGKPQQSGRPQRPTKPQSSNGRPQKPHRPQRPVEQECAALGTKCNCDCCTGYCAKTKIGPTRYCIKREDTDPIPPTCKVQPDNSAIDGSTDPQPASGSPTATLPVESIPVVGGGLQQGADQGTQQTASASGGGLKPGASGGGLTQPASGGGLAQPSPGGGLAQPSPGSGLTPPASGLGGPAAKP